MCEACIGVTCILGRPGKCGFLELERAMNDRTGVPAGQRSERDAGAQLAESVDEFKIVAVMQRKNSERTQQRREAWLDCAVADDETDFAWHAFLGLDHVE